jgi:hypothetical protein
MELSLADSIVHTLAYADIFDFPLTENEIHRRLAYCAASLPEVRQMLAGQKTLSRVGDYYTLPGRENIVSTRARRKARADQLWPIARHYAKIIFRLPFVRMIAVTGALAVENIDDDGDIDYFIVTDAGRLWLCRLMILAVAKWAARARVTLCPNYLVSERALVFQEQNLYSAHELAQMIPLDGLDTYRRIVSMNDWVRRFLPNALPHRSDSPPPDSRYRTQSLLETLLRIPPVDALERWEMNRKIRKLSRQPSPSSEASFSADRCKGHFNNHGQHTQQALIERLEALSFPLRVLEPG